MALEPMGVAVRLAQGTRVTRVWGTVEPERCSQQETVRWKPTEEGILGGGSHDRTGCGKCPLHFMTRAIEQRRKQQVWGNRARET